MTREIGLALTLVVGIAGAAGAQEQDLLFFSAPLDAAEQAPVLMPMPAPGPAPLIFERSVDVMMAEPLDAGEPVTGAPYSADAVTEVVQVLADGNRIERQTRSSVARDSQGRVRRTQQLAAIGPLLPTGGSQIVTINDPVAKTHYSLDPDRKVAFQMPPMFTRAVAPPPLPQAPQGAGLPREPRTESLGTRSFDGVAAEGTRSTVTIAAGAIGNQAPIDIVSERWYSPELQTVVYSTRTDPRFGETTFRLENIVRSEPSADLFQVPADYTIESGPPFGAGIRIQRR